MSDDRFLHALDGHRCPMCLIVGGHGVLTRSITTSFQTDQEAPKLTTASGKKLRTRRGGKLSVRVAVMAVCTVHGRITLSARTE